ncbi:sigma-70 family RNA polymerase sigma factor [Desulfococcaceae bacterium HSG8]|nr:sigma-70 family RNA polymerase sigma factor [Desulfococcaceae bacterium HSG8]
MKRLTRKEEGQLLYECLLCCRKDKLAKQYWRLIFHTAKRILTMKRISYKTDDIEELRNESFVRLFDKNCRKLWQYKEGGKASLAGWIMLITTQTVLDYIRKLPPPIFTDPPDSPPHEHLSELSKQLVRDNLEELPSRDRLILNLFYYKGLTSEDIASFLHMAVGSVYTAKSRALKRLGALIEKDLEQTDNGR